MYPAETRVISPEDKAIPVPSIVKLSLTRAEIMVLSRLYWFDVLMKAAEVVTPAAVTLPVMLRLRLPEFQNQPLLAGEEAITLFLSLCTDCLWTCMH